MIKLAAIAIVGTFLLIAIPKLLQPESEATYFAYEVEGNHTMENTEGLDWFVAESHRDFSITLSDDTVLEPEKIAGSEGEILYEIRHDGPEVLELVSFETDGRIELRTHRKLTDSVLAQDEEYTDKTSQLILLAMMFLGFPAIWWIFSKNA